MSGIQVAIDGPASSGKSTVAKIIAHRFNYVYVDTGAMYRSVTLAALDRGVDLGDQDALAQLARQLKISFQPGEDGQRVFIDGQEVTTSIRTPRVATNVSTVAAVPEVRKALVEAQRQLAQQGGVVMDGRDIGTTVLPNAPVKIFLVASAHERARRRYSENVAKGIETAPLAELQKQIELRDQKDSTRSVSPLTQAADAVKVDSTNLSIDQVVARISRIIEKKLKEIAE